MTAKEFLYNLTEEYGTAEFVYKGVRCGVEPKTSNRVTTYSMWYGEKSKIYNNVDRLMNDCFFDGLCLSDILEKVSITF